MVRPLARAAAGYLRRPLDIILGTPSHIAVLRALAGTAAGLSGRGVARAAGIAQRAAMEALARLEWTGIVRRHCVGRTYSFRLNREHVLVAGALIPLLEQEAAFRRGLLDALRASPPRGILTAASFGSAARDEEGPRSDLDLLLLVRRAADKEDALSFADRMRDRLGATYGVRLSALVFTRDEFRRALRKGDDLQREIIRDAKPVWGPPLSEIVHDA